MPVLFKAPVVALKRQFGNFRIAVSLGRNCLSCKRDFLLKGYNLSALYHIDESTVIVAQSMITLKGHFSSRVPCRVDLGSDGSHITAPLLPSPELLIPRAFPNKCPAC